MSTNRLIFYFTVILSIPFFLTLHYFYAEGERLDEISLSLEILEGEILLKEKKQAENKAVRALFRDSDHFYIDKHLEPLPVLQKEVEAIEKLFEQPIPLSEPVRKRYEFLTSGQNGISFIEGQVKSYPTFQETIETLSHPIEVDLDDLKRLLTLIEGSSIGSEPPPAGRPHLLITEFKMDKKEGLNEREHLQLSLKLLKREYL